MATVSSSFNPTPFSNLPTLKTDRLKIPPKSGVPPATIHYESCKNQHNPNGSFHLQDLSSLCKSGQLQKAVDFIRRVDARSVDVGIQFYSELLQACVYDRALFLGRQIHALIVKKGREYAGNEYIQTKLVIFYAKCDDLEMSNRLFLKIGEKNVFSWAAMIGLYSKLGLSAEALRGYCDMLENGVLPDNFVIPNALKACGVSHYVSCGRGIHGYVMKMGFGECVFVSSSLIDMYGKCGLLNDAHKVFDNMTERNVVAWNSLIVSYFQNGMNEEAIQAFHDMRIEGGVDPTRVTISILLSASASIKATAEGKQVHALANLYGLSLDSILGSSVLNFYSKLGFVEDSELVFEKMVEKDVVTWNLLISCYVQYGLFKNALGLCHQMRLHSLRFDCVTLRSILSVAADTSDLVLGKQGHCYCIRNHFDSDVFVTASIVNMYAKCSKIKCSRQAFDSSLQRDLVLYNTLLAGYGELGLSGEAFKLFYRMQLEGLSPDAGSYNSVILAFFQNGQVDQGKEMFSLMQALNVDCNTSTWINIINGLVKNGLSHEAVSFFRKMQEGGVKPNSVAMMCVISAAVDMASFRLGKEAHGYVTRQGLFLYTEVAASLGDMYSRLGRAKDAKNVYDMMEIEGHELHGLAGNTL